MNTHRNNLVIIHRKPTARDYAIAGSKVALANQDNDRDNILGLGAVLKVGSSAAKGVKSVVNAIRKMTREEFFQKRDELYSQAQRVYGPDWPNITGFQSVASKYAHSWHPIAGNYSKRFEELQKDFNKYVLGGGSNEAAKSSTIANALVKNQSIAPGTPVVSHDEIVAQASAATGKDLSQESGAKLDNELSNYVADLIQRRNNGEELSDIENAIADTGLSLAAGAQNDIKTKSDIGQMLQDNFIWILIGVAVLLLLMSKRR